MGLLITGPGLGRRPAPCRPAVLLARQRGPASPALRLSHAAPSDTAPGGLARARTSAGPGRHVLRLPAPRSKGLGRSGRQRGRLRSGRSLGSASRRRREPLRGCSTGMAPCRPTATLWRGQKDSPGPNITALLGPHQGGFCADKRNLPVNDKKPGLLPSFSSNLKPSASSSQGRRGKLPPTAPWEGSTRGSLSGRQPGLFRPSHLQ